MTLVILFETITSMENIIEQTEPDTHEVSHHNQKASGEKQESQNSILNERGNALIILGGIIFLIIFGGVYYFYTHKMSQPLTPQSPVNTKTNSQVTPTTQPASLNPNTGNLYGDIKVRLKEVLK